MNLQKYELLGPYTFNMSQLGVNSDRKVPRAYASN